MFPWGELEEKSGVDKGAGGEGIRFWWGVLEITRFRFFLYFRDLKDFPPPVPGPWNFFSLTKQLGTDLEKCSLVSTLCLA